MILTVEHYNQVISVATGRNDLHIVEMWDEMIEPMLLGMGFAQGAIDRHFAITRNEQPEFVIKPF